MAGEEKKDFVLDMGAIQSPAVGAEWLESRFETHSSSSDLPLEGDMTQQRSRAPKLQSSQQPQHWSGWGEVMLASAREKTASTLNYTSHVDRLRPYFDVEPREVLLRLRDTFNPLTAKAEVPPELYGPTMLVFSLAAILLLEMKHASHDPGGERTQIGTALFVAFMYWFLSSAVAATQSHIHQGTLSTAQIMSLTGYALTAHCIILACGTLLHSESEFLFYLLFVSLGGATAAKLAAALHHHSAQAKAHQRLYLAGSTAALHLLSLLHLHFAYHEDHHIDDLGRM